MAKHQSVRQAVRLALLMSTAPAILISPALAQEQDSSETMDEVVVTGSRIVSPNLQSISPITAIGSEELSLTGKTRIEDVLNQLPQAFAAQGGNISNDSDGTASVDLRGLGSQRTLVLVNGRRLMPGDPDGGSAADLNQIPLSLVKRVDVLTGGASSVYGADAVAGVVNFVMDTDFEGVRIDSNYSFYQHSNDQRPHPERGRRRAATICPSGTFHGRLCEGLLHRGRYRRRRGTRPRDLLRHAIAKSIRCCSHSSTTARAR